MQHLFLNTETKVPIFFPPSKRSDLSRKFQQYAGEAEPLQPGSPNCLLSQDLLLCGDSPLQMSKLFCWLPCFFCLVVCDAFQAVTVTNSSNCYLTIRVETAAGCSWRLSLWSRQANSSFPEGRRKMILKKQSSKESIISQEAEFQNTFWKVVI